MTNPLISQEEIDNTLNMLVVPLAMKLQLITQRNVLRPANLGLQQWRIILTLARYGDVHLRKLTRLTLLDPAHASRVAADLEERGIITRRRDPDDNRRRLLSLTEDGIQLMRSMWPQYNNKARIVRDEFSEDEFQFLKKMLQRATAMADEILTEDTGV